MFRSTAFASLAALAAVVSGPSTAPAQEMTDTTGVLAPQVGNVVGGGSSTMVGSGEDMVIHYSRGGAGGGASLAQPGRLARFAGSDGDGQARWDHPAATDPARTGREGWLSGSGDDAQVTYAVPRAQRRR